MRQRNQKFNFVVLALRSKRRLQPFVMLHATPIQLVSQNVLSCMKEIGKSSVCRKLLKKKCTWKRRPKGANNNSSISHAWFFSNLWVIHWLQHKSMYNPNHNLLLLLKITKVENCDFPHSKSSIWQKRSMYVSSSFFGAKVWMAAKIWEIFVTNLMIFKTKIVHT